MKNRARSKKLGKRLPNPLKLDPTRTTMLRRAAIADVRRRFARLILAIDTLLVKEDSFGLARRREGPRSPFTWNAFCPTGEGGGVDPSCGASGGEGTFVRVMAKERGGSAKSEVKVGVDQSASMISAMIWSSRGKNKGWGKGLLHDGKIYAWPESDSESSHHGSVAEALGLPAPKFGREGYKKIYFRQGIDEPLEVRAEHRADAEFVKSKLKNVVVANVVKFTTNERWELKSSPEQLAAFQEWLRKQLKWYVVGMTEDMLWARYVQEGFRKGAGRAFDDLRSKRGPTFRSDDFAQGQRQQFLATSFRRPETVEKVKILASRTFEELTNVGEEIRLKLGRVLTDGLARGDNPRVVAREMTRQLAIPQRRAETIARTEIIRAHAEGQLSAMEDLGVDEVGVMVEWSTAGDDRVCESCSVMEGVVLKLEEAHGMIPRHPSCRCSFVPANVGESRKEQVRGKTKIEKQIDLSARLAGDTFDVGIEIDKNRPRALVSPTKNVENAFSPTGPGGGVDPTCSSSAGGSLDDVPSSR